MLRSANLKRLLYPSSIAVFGGSAARTVVTQCRDIGFTGPIWAVHPQAKTIEGAESFTAPEQLPAAPDASFIGVPAAGTLEIVSQLSAMGAGGAVCFASGFAELTEQGKQRQNTLLELAGDMAIVGPNCHGTINFLDGVALWPDHHGGRRVNQGVALIVQSGNIGINLSFQQRSLDVSHIISVGNSAQLALHDYINVLLDDDRVTAIGLHVEGLRDVPRFSKVAIRALQKKVPIVAIKTGNSKLGAQLTLSHTNSLASERELVASLFRRYGIARCHSLEQFVETLKFVSIAGVIQGQRIGSISCSGGEASLVADSAAEQCLKLPKLSARSAQALRVCLGNNVHISNPLDYHNYVWGDKHKLTECFSAVLSNRFDCCFLILDYPSADGANAAAWITAEQALVSAQQATGQLAVLVSTLPENLPQPVRERLKQLGIAPMQGLQTCLQAIAAAAAIGAAQNRCASLQVVNRPGVLVGNAKVINEWDSKQLLSQYGLTIPKSRLVKAEHTVEAAESVGFPVVLKAVSESIVHKSELAAVAINLHSTQELLLALTTMARISSYFLVERMIKHVALELLVGIKHDTDFGLVLVLGAGGTQVELLNDTVSVLLPATSEDIHDALHRLQISKRFDGFRGSPKADIIAAISAIELLVAFAERHRRSLFELEVNPLMVCPLIDNLTPQSDSGCSGAVVADAFMAFVED